MLSIIKCMIIKLYARERCAENKGRRRGKAARVRLGPKVLWIFYTSPTAARSHRGRIVVIVDDSDYVSDIPRGTLVGRSRGDLSPQPCCTPHERSAGALREQ
jgi:hypothetical protein